MRTGISGFSKESSLLVAQASDCFVIRHWQSLTWVKEQEMCWVLLWDFCEWVEWPAFAVGQPGDRVTLSDCIVLVSWVEIFLGVFWFFFFKDSSSSMPFYETQDFREVIPTVPVETTLGSMGRDSKLIRIRLFCSAVSSERGTKTIRDGSDLPMLPTHILQTSGTLAYAACLGFCWWVRQTNAVLSPI